MKTNILIFILLTLLLSSCHYTAYVRLLHIKYGMPSNEVMQILASDNFDNKDVHLINGEKDFYDLENLKQTINPTKVLITKKYYLGQVGDKESFYIFAFENDKLIYWGLPLEFARVNDLKLNEIGELTVKIIQKEYIDKN